MARRELASDAAGQVRIGHQSHDRESARPLGAADAACPRRRGDQVTRRALITLLGDKQMTEVIRKDRTSSLRCRPVQSTLQARAGRPLPNSCPCASFYSGWLAQSCGSGPAAAGFLRMPLLASRVARNRRLYAHVTALARRISPFRPGAGAAFKERRE